MIILQGYSNHNYTILRHKRGKSITQKACFNPFIFILTHWRKSQSVRCQKKPKVNPTKNNCLETKTDSTFIYYHFFLYPHNFYVYPTQVVKRKNLLPPSPFCSCPVVSWYIQERNDSIVQFRRFLDYIIQKLFFTKNDF